MGYTKVALTGVSWMGLLRGSTRILAIVKIAIIARLIGPLEFGVFGVATLVLAFLEIISETGINAFLIQEQADIKKYMNTAWFVSILRGVFITLLILLLSHPIATFFNAPQSQNVLIYISLIPLIRGFVNPAIIKFQKNLQFKKEFNLRVILFTFDALVAIAFSIILRNALGLVIGMLAAAIVEVILSFVLIRPLPKFIFEKHKTRVVINRGKWITLAGVFDYLFHNGDDIVVGRLMDTFSLGLYQVAYKIAILPITEVGEIISKVVFPVYSKIAKDKVRLKRAYIRILITISLFTIPFGLLLILFAGPFVRLLLGEEWLLLIPALKVLVVFGVVRAISGSTSAVFLALKKQEYVTIITLVSIVGLGITIIPLVRNFGILGAAWSSLIGAVFSIPVMYYYFRKEFT